MSRSKRLLRVADAARTIKRHRFSGRAHLHVFVQRVILLDSRRRRECSGWVRTAEQFRQNHGGVEMALLDRAQDTGEDFLRVRPARRPIAAAHFAGDHRGPQRMLSAPIGGVNRIRGTEGNRSVSVDEVCVTGLSKHRRRVKYENGDRMHQSS